MGGKNDRKTDLCVSYGYVVIGITRYMGRLIDGEGLN